MNCLAERLALRRARAIIAVSEAVGRYVREQGFGVHVVPNGVPASESRCRSRRRDVNMSGRLIAPSFGRTRT